jgi:hypothetical protein
MEKAFRPLLLLSAPALGRTDGGNIRIDVRWAGGDVDWIQRLATAAGGGPRPSRSSARPALYRSFVGYLSHRHQAPTAGGSETILRGGVVFSAAPSGARTDEPGCHVQPLTIVPCSALGQRKAPSASKSVA